MPRVLSYPPYVGQVGDNPGNEVGNYILSMSKKRFGEGMVHLIIIIIIIIFSNNDNNNNSKIPGNINIHELQKIDVTLDPFYSPPSQAGPLHQVETLFASQSPWFGLGC